MLKLIILCIFILCSGLVYAKDDAASLTAQANRLYAEGKYDEALSLYNRALIDQPDSARLNFNIGAANYKKGDYEKAVGYFEKSALTEDKILEFKANYNSGNSQFKSAKLKEEADLESAVALMRQSLEHYKRAMELAPKYEDAKINHDIAQKELKAMLEKLKNQPRDKQPAQNKGQCPNPQQSESGNQANKDADKQKAESENKKTQGEDKEAKEAQEAKEAKEAQEAQEAKESQEAGQKEGREEDKQPAYEAAPEKAKEMSEQEARMLLEGQRQDEVLGGKAMEAQEGRWAEVEKDW